MNEYLEKLKRHRSALEKAIAEEEAKQPSVGSLDWAIQRMREGEKIFRPDWEDETARISMVDENTVRWESGISETYIWNLDDWARPMSDKYKASGWQIYTEPKPEQPKSAYQVGDFVVCTYYRSPLPPKNSYERVIEVSGSGIVTKSNDGYVTNYDINGNHGDINGWHIERLVKPEEYIICIGCLSGTVAEHFQGSDWAFRLIHGNGKESYISFHALDTSTRELVESLLKAQEEEK